MDRARADCNLDAGCSKFGMRTFERPDHPSAASGNRKEPDHLVVPQR
jgi:hypothetical protein